MLQAQDRAAKIKSNQVKDEVAEIEARLEFLRARLAARAEPNGADAQIGPQGLEAADDEREKAEAELQKARYRWEQAMQDAAEVALELLATCIASCSVLMSSSVWSLARFRYAGGLFS